MEDVGTEKMVDAEDLGFLVLATRSVDVSFTVFAKDAEQAQEKAEELLDEHLFVHVEGDGTLDHELDSDGMWEITNMEDV